MKLLFADESGNLGVKFSRYFVITILIVPSYTEYKKLEKSVVKFRKHKFKKELKEENELKAHKSSMKLKVEMINKLNKLNIKSLSIYIDKKDPKFKKMYNEKHNNEIYTCIMKELIKYIKIETPFILRLDHYILRKFKDFFEITITKEIEDYENTSKIYHVPSEKYVGIQFADLIAWIVLKSLEDKNRFYIDKLNKKHNIIEYKIK